MSKPYRDRRKRGKYTKSVNVPYFPLALRIVSILYPDQNVD